MTLIHPKNVKDCQRTLRENENEIKGGIYDVVILSGWVKRLKVSDQVLLAQYCPSSRKVLAASHDCHPIALNTLHAFTRDDPEKKTAMRQLLAANHHAPSEVLSILANDNWQDKLGRYITREKVAGNPGADSQLLVTMAESNADNLDILEIIARHPHAPAELMARFVARNELRLLRSLLGNTNAPAAILSELASHPAAEIRLSVARRQDTPASILDRLSKDEDKEIRLAVAKHPKTPQLRLEALARDKTPIYHWDVVKSFSKNDIQEAAEENLRRRKRQETARVLLWVLGILIAAMGGLLLAGLMLRWVGIF